ncbi:myristoylated alanine-rich C-kinase substrate-like [Trichechus manatus latirostris]|uniref:Myristoylated alanine-rich C-kinase substrate-like n=1 Tax=Trichechus manatus latirostris TaxID=127582 RepID=A0A2Y9RGP2_TRIMA|nr:myristoylated alanine-rich C-kinase substrate-like [Trichechus manatus latirostris]
MATAGISRSGQPAAAPAGLATAKARSAPSPGGAKWTKGDPQARALGASGAPETPSLSEATHFPSEGAAESRRGRRSASAFPLGASVPSAAGERSATQRAPFPAAAAAATQPIAQTQRVQPARLGRCFWKRGVGLEAPRHLREDTKNIMHCPSA